MTVALSILFALFLGMFVAGVVVYRWALKQQAHGSTEPRPLAAITPPQGFPVAAPEPVALQPQPVIDIETVYVCLREKGRKPQTIKVPAKARRHRLFIDGRAWEHYGQEGGTWFYTPTEGQTARQRHMEARR
jgi:hypothetical protein